MKMLIKLYILIVASFFFPCKLSAQEYSTNNISDSLKKNANAVVRYRSATFTQTSMNSATYKEYKAITILRKKGEMFAHFKTYEDKFRSLSSFSGIVRDASGKIIRKIKKGDLTYMSGRKKYLPTIFLFSRLIFN